MRLFLKIVLFTLVAPGTITVLLPSLLLRGGPGWRVEGARALVGGPLMLAGALLYAWCAYAFGRFGQGTPAPIDPPRHLAYAGAVFLGFHVFTVLYEEPAHRRRFGAAFDEYCRRVPRWIPRLAR